MAVIDWGALDLEVPVLFLPLRIETQTEAAPEDAPEDAPVRLRVRIMPDDLGVDPSTGRPLLLPDAFVVVARVGGAWLPAVEGAPVRLDHLGLGTADGTTEERFAALAASMRGLTRHDDPATEWLWSYERAVEVGMAVTVELPPRTEEVELLAVLGARTGRVPEEESEAVAAALGAHEDAGFLRPGDATNSTEAGRSAWSRPDTVAGGPPAPEAVEHDSAARVLARALGTAGAVLGDRPGAGHRGERWAGAMATALWPVTWGHFLDRGVAPGAVGPDAVEAIRRHHAAAVRGRGPLPLLRVARQPYGVLPVTPLGRFTDTDRALDRLASLLRSSARLWEIGSRSVPTVGRGGVRALPAILGQSPVSWGLRLRRLLGTGGPFATVVAAQSYEQAQARADLTAVLESIAGLRPGTFADPALLSVDRTLGLPLVADDDPDVLAALGEGGVPGEASVLQVLLGLAVSMTQADLDARLGRERGSVLLQDLRGGALGQRLGQEAASYAADLVLEPLVGGDEPRAPEAAEALRLVDEAIGPWSTSPWAWRFQALPPELRPPDVRGPLDELRGLLRAAVVAGQVREAVRVLAEVADPDERRGLLAEALDCASHRHDAWVTSLATARLARMRARRSEGISVGAYGWVEDLRLVRRTRPADPAEPVRQPAGPGGAVHAPSLAHAATAAVLRGARLAHAPGDEADRALEMDLSSTRVREAREVLAGMRAGQELGALLGYRFERWLGDADPVLNRFVAGLRALAPTVAAKEVDRVAEGLVELGVEVVAASQVVDGVRLLEVATRPDGSVDPTPVLTALSGPPAALARYAAPWTAPTPAEGAHLTSALERLGGLLDAVGDLLLAEGVHQLVAGNPARAAAAMDALSGDGLPPEPDVAAPPVDRSGLTHRLAVLLPATGSIAPAAGWTVTPRAQANPRLEAWCRVVLGPASRVVVSPDGRTLQSLHVAALDVVEAAGSDRLGLEAFWARARRTTRGLPPTPLVDRPRDLAARRSTLGETWLLAATLRSLLTSARPLEPADLVHEPREDVLRDEPGAPPAGDPWLTSLRTLVDRLAGLAATPPPSEDRGLAPALDALAAFGLGDGSAPDDPVLRRAQLTAVLDQAGARAAELDARLTAATTVAELAAVARDLTGSALPVPVPLAAAGSSGPPGPPEPLAVAWDADDGSHRHSIRPWLARHARVRTAVRDWTSAAMLRSAAERPAPLRAVTLGLPTWLGETLPDGAAPESAHTSLVVEAVPGVHPGEDLSGLVLDGWHETMPRRRSVRDDTSTTAEDGVPPPPEEVVATGLAVHANGPDSRAPQTLLLGVPPDGGPWSLETALDLLLETRDQARRRMVPLERLPLAGSVLPALTVEHWSLQGERVLDPRLLSTVADASTTPRFVRFED